MKRFKISALSHDERVWTVVSAASLIFFLTKKFTWKRRKRDLVAHPSSLAFHSTIVGRAEVAVDFESCVNWMSKQTFYGRPIVPSSSLSTIVRKYMHIFKTAILNELNKIDSTFKKRFSLNPVTKSVENIHKIFLKYPFPSKSKLKSLLLPRN